VSGLATQSARNPRQPTVVIVYKDLPHYRVRFFELLRDSLAAEGVTLALVYGQAVGASLAKRDTQELNWADHIKSRTLTLGGKTLYWQPVLSYVRGADLIIVEQASRLLVNYVLLILNVLGVTRLCFWGHGRNFQSGSPGGIAEAFKRFYSRHIHWWFAYNETSAAVVRELGFPAERITLVQNAIDTSALREQVHGTVATDIASLRRNHGLRGRNVCLYVGGMYPEKRIPFLVESAAIIRRSVPDFELVMIGAGPDQSIAERADVQYPWLHYVGPVFGQDLATYFAASKLVLMPGLVGLGVLDSFAAGVPMVTTDVPYHSPEIEYLSDGVNGIVVRDFESVEKYAAEVVALLGDDLRRKRLVSACEESARLYTVETMVERFSAGVMSAIGDR